MERQDDVYLGVFSFVRRFSDQVCRFGVPNSGSVMPKVSLPIFRNRHGTFYYRMGIPVSLQPYIQKTEMTHKDVRANVE